MNVSQAVAQIIRRLRPAAVLRFAADPIGAVESAFGIRATASPSLTKRRGDGGACDGVSFLDDGILFYAPTPHSKRDSFTIAHEVGHHLVNSDDAVSGWVYDQDDHEAILETICDRVAQQLLLPPDSVEAFLEARMPRAQDVLDLYEGSAASRPVCAIAIAQHLPRFGAVVIIERATMTVTSSSIHADPQRGWPFIYPWPGQIVPLGHQLRNVADGSDVIRRVSWRGRFGVAREDFYVNALGTQNGIIAVFSADDVWGAPELARLPERAWDTRPSLSGNCCGRSFQVKGYPCPTCRKAICPQCGKCPHERADASDINCSICFTLKPPRRVVDGVCDVCR